MPQTPAPRPTPAPDSSAATRHRNLLAAGASFLFSLLVFWAGWCTAEGVRAGLDPQLDEPLGMEASSLPYYLGIIGVGIATALLFILVAFLLVAGWRTRVFLTGVRILVWACLLIVAGSTVWFIARTDLFNIVGVLGVAFSLTGAVTLLAICRSIARELPTQGD